MKYQIEMSEGEYVATLRMVETLCTTLFRGQVNIASASVEKEKPAHEPRVEKTLEKDNDDVAQTSSATAYYEVEWGTLDPVPPPTWLKHEEPPTAAHIGRGPVDAIKAPKEDAVPSAVPSGESVSVPPVEGKFIAKGREIFNHLIHLWVVGYKQEGVSQPDRAEEVRKIANGRSAYKVLTYVKSVGGITYAVNAALPSETRAETEEERQALVLDVAGNVTQVSSILFPDLSDLYEYKNIFQSEDNDDE